MLNKFLRRFIFSFFILINICFFSFVNESYAYKDEPEESNYGYINDNGTGKFTNEKLDFGTAALYLPYSIPVLEKVANDEGRAAISLFSNEACSTEVIASYILFLYGNNNVRASAAITLTGLTVYNYYSARNAFENLELCGSNWYIWGNNKVINNSITNSVLDKKQYYPILGAFPGSLKHEAIKCKNDVTKCSASDEFKKSIGKIEKAADIRFKEYREVIYDGVEVENNSCDDPRSEALTYDVNYGKNYDSENLPHQLYYMKGSLQANYACERFYNRIQDMNNPEDKYKKAYDCCVKASKNVCVSYKPNSKDEEHIFCPIGGSGNGIFKELPNLGFNAGLCWMTGSSYMIGLKLKGSLDTPGEYCINTWNFCPYNFNLETGTEKILKFDDEECFDSLNKKTLSCEGKIKNFYQYKRHCTIVEPWRPSDEDEYDYPPFIDKACINFVGSSHNTINYKPYHGYKRNFDDYNSFTAPMAECVAETLKNFLFNKAGHTKCQIATQIPDEDGICKSGYEYQEGDDLSEVGDNIQPPSSILLKRLQNIMILVVTLMVTLYGYNILINQGKIEMKNLLPSLIKLVIVLVFSLNNWWYTQLFKFVYGFSNSFSTIVTKIAFDDSLAIYKNNRIYMKYDGCYFGNPNSIYGPGYDAPAIGNNNYLEYPPSRRYIAFFDSLDCKIAKYLGYSDNSSFKYQLLFLLALSIIFPFSIGLFMAVGTFMLAFFAIFFAMNAVYIFVISALGLTVLLFLSPIILPCILFKKWQNIFFDKWIQNVLGFALQPMILFAYITVAVTIMDNYTIGDGAFNSPEYQASENSNPRRDLICGYSCSNEKGGNVQVIRSDENVSEFKTNCESIEGNIYKPIKQNSVLCFMDNISFDQIEFLLPIGLNLSQLTDFSISLVISFLRCGLLMFLLYKVMLTVPGIAMTIVGARLPNMKNADPFKAGLELFGKMRSLKGIVANVFSKKANDKNE